MATVYKASPLVLSAYTAGKNFTTVTTALDAIPESSDIKGAGGLNAVIFPNPAGGIAILRISNAAKINIAVTYLVVPQKVCKRHYDYEWWL